MRSLIGFSLLAAIGLVPASASGQEVEALRKELEGMRKQFEEMRQGYEKAINQLSERLHGLESRPQPAAAPAVTAPTAPPTANAGTRDPMLTQPGGQPSPLELARPR